MQRYGIVLAAGQGTRMKSATYKVLHSVCGKPMVDHVITMLERLEMDALVTIVGHGAEAVRTFLGNRTEYVIQEQQLGTGHAVLQAEAKLSDKDGTTIVICGDTPLLTTESIQTMVSHHEQAQAAATILTASLEKPFGYGRIVRGKDGSVQRIVEQKDCSVAEDRIKEINTGTYCFDNRKLFQALKKVTNDNVQQEYYLTDVIAILKNEGETIEGCLLEDADEAIGVNDRVALSVAEKSMRRRINRRHMKNGVTLIDPDHTYIDADVRIGGDTIVYPGCTLSGETVIGSDCLIGPNVELAHATVGNGVHIKQSVIHDSSVASDATIGPFAYIRPGSQIGEKVKIGDFVEIKNSRVGSGSKVPHHSYVGDAEIGENVNIGCGVITANYDGFKKQRTTVSDGAFIGSNVNLIAPVHIGKGAYVVAGSTITEDVEADAIAIARSKQTNKAGYAQKLKQRLQRKGESPSTGG